MSVCSVPFMYLVSGDFISLYDCDGFLERISRSLLLMDFSKGHLHLIRSIGKSSDHADSISLENPVLLVLLDYCLIVASTIMQILNI